MKRNYNFIRKSPFSGIINTMPIVLDFDDYEAWMNGALIQNVLGYLLPDEREFLMTGITPAEWEETFGG